jgi:ribonucleotide reductase alpha subunit
VAKPTPKLPALSHFDEHAIAIAKRQYFQPGDDDLSGMFERVAAWVASPEREGERERYTQAFFELMASKRFCPGGRVLAGAATNHGNVLNCFVQDGSPEKEGTNAWVLRLATKLALVTKVGGGNGLCLDPLPPKRSFEQAVGKLYLTIAPSHPDYEKVKYGTYMDLVHGKYVTKGYRYASFLHESARAAKARTIKVGDSVESIWQSGAKMIEALLSGEDVLLDLSDLRPEGTPVRGSGGTSSGPSSFAVEVFDNFAYWASLGGAEYAGPVATLRYIFAPTLRVIRQGGCLHPDTLVHTSRGTLRLREFVDPYQYGWQDHRLQVATDEGWKESPRGYNNGVAETLKVTLANGQEIQGTPNHKLKVMRKSGERMWVPLAELKPGDYVIQVLDQHTGAPVLLAPLDEARLHHNSKRIRTPEVLSETLAFFLGYFWGDGFTSDGRVGLAVAHDSPMMAKAPELFRELFGLEVRCEQKPGDKSVVFVTKSASLVAWLKQNDFEKGRARGLELPRAIRQAPRPVVGAFLRGLFEADGTITHGYPELTSASKQLLQDVMVMLGGLGIPAKMTRYAPSENRYSKHASYRLRVVSAKGLERYLERVGVMAGSRFEALYEVRPDTHRESAWPLPHAAALLTATLQALPVGAKGRPSAHTPARKTLSRYIRGERTLTMTGFASLKRDPLVAEKLPAFDESEYYVPVKSVAPGGRILTLDLSVDENYTYLANGMVSHNTRRGAGMATMSITHPDIQDFITAKDLHREKEEGDISTFNISVLVSDEFMQRSKLEQGTLYDIADHAHQTGEPGLIFIDRINAYNPMRAAYGDIKATNPCVIGDAYILTQKGPVKFHDLAEAGEDVPVWCVDKRTGELKLSTMVRPHLTRKSTEVLEITLESGFKIRATPDHSFFDEDFNKVAARALKPGQSISALQISAVALNLSTLQEPGKEVVFGREGYAGISLEAVERGYRERYGSIPSLGTTVVRNVQKKELQQLRPIKIAAVTPAGTADVYNGMVESYHTYLIVNPSFKEGKPVFKNDEIVGVVSANCGEIPLFPGEPCDLGAINLAEYVRAPNIGTDGFAWEDFKRDVKTCIRFLDNVLEVNKFALEDNREMSMKLRRLGLGIMGLADALIKMGYRYDSDEGRAATEAMIAALRDSATEASEALAEERGAFPEVEKSTLKTPRRNVALLTVAPTGTTSMLMGVSSGIEPVFAPFIYRKIGSEYKSLIHPLFKELLERHAPHPDFAKGESWDWEKVVAAVQENHGSLRGLEFIPDDVRAVLVCAHDIAPEDHVKMQGVVQATFDGGGKMVANSISKTINLPNSATVGDVYSAYSLAFEVGCKGITVYRDGSREFQVLSTKAEKKEEREEPVQAAVAPGSSHALEAKQLERLPGEPLFDRPGRLTGFTDAVKLTLPTGEKRGFYVTVNKQDDLPTEVFIVSGKAGDEANADAEALGRLTSIALQYGVPAEAIVKTLRGINGGMYGTYQGRMVASKADLIAVALETAGVENPLQQQAGKRCPECGGKHLRFEEGCVKCEVCGYSKCG